MLRDLFLRKRCWIGAILCLLLFFTFPVTVQAKTPKTVKIYDFTSGNQKVDGKVRAIIRKEIKPGMSTAQKVKAIHDYMVLNCEYDYKNYLNGTIPRKSYGVEGFILKKKAVCQGYAETFQLFMEALHIPCQLVVGQANNGGGYAGHAWNIVKVSGKWYHIDVTWDDPVPDRKGRISYGYFLIPDKKMDDDHRWDRSKYHKCVSGSDRFAKLLGKVSKNKDDMAEAFYNYFADNKNGRLQIIVHKKGYADYHKIVSDIEDTVEKKYWKCVSAVAYSKEEYGNYYIMSFYNVTLTDVMMKNCRSCDRQISVYCEQCPYCGFDFTKIFDDFSDEGEYDSFAY